MRCRRHRSRPVAGLEGLGDGAGVVLEAGFFFFFFCREKSELFCVLLIFPLSLSRNVKGKQNNSPVNSTTSANSDSLARNSPSPGLSSTSTPDGLSLDPWPTRKAAGGL